MKTMDQVLAAARAHGPKGLAVAVAEDVEVLEAVKHAQENGIIRSFLVGNAAKIREKAAEVGYNLADVEVVDAPSIPAAAAKAVELVAAGQADLLMKGKLGTADIMRAVLDKEKGLRTGRILSHIAMLEVEGHDRLYFMTDGGLNIAPDLAKKVDIIQNAIDCVRALGIEQPKVACLAALELVNPDMPVTLDAAALAKMADRGQIKGGLVDGPLALDNAVSEEAARIKGIVSPVAGKADILFVPDIEAGNIFYKSLAFLARAGVRQAGIIVGARCPVVLLSRSDEADAKLNSIAFAVVYAAGKSK
ncbi:MAG: phosphate butyryltransferase [Bacillota bacterium]